MAGLRSSTLFGQPDTVVRAWMLSEKARNLEPRLRSSNAFLSSDVRHNHSMDTPTMMPVKKTTANPNQRCCPSAASQPKAPVVILENAVAVSPLELEKT